MSATILGYNADVHRDGVIHLWTTVFGYETEHNDPALALDRKRAIGDDLIFVALSDSNVIGSIMAGYDGHRGWLYALAVLPGHRNKGIGSSLVSEAERALTALGCMKINLQINQSNESVPAFYASLGYSKEERISMGKCIPQNIVRKVDQGNATDRGESSAG